MKIPINTAVKLVSQLYSYFFKGAKIDGSLQYYRGGEENDPNRDSFMLTLQNNSKYNAYDIKILNWEDIFYSMDKINPLISLQPLHSMIVFYRFEDSTLDNFSVNIIPKDKIGKQLIISYKNEGRNKFYTKFTINDKEPINEYCIRNPLKRKN